MARVAAGETDWRSVMEQRLQCVLTALVQLQEAKSGQRELHEARVACRRAEAGLRLCRDLLPTKPVQWLRKYIRKVRQATNPTRDQDVLRKWLKKQKSPVAAGICRSLKQQREETLARMIKSMGNPLKLQEHASHLARPAQVTTPHDWPSSLGRRLLDEAFHFLRCMPGNDSESDTESLHEFRIASKRLRYACELTTEVLPEVNFRSVLKLLQQIQTRLGQIHDTAARIVQLKPLDKSERAEWLRASRLEQQQLTREWTSWWRSIPCENVIGSAITQIVKVIRGLR